MVEIVAEISGNHGGLLSKMLDMICKAAECGCDYAKFQYYTPIDMPDAHEDDNWAMYNKLMVHDYWLSGMFKCAKENSIGLFASVFSLRAAKEILKYDVPYIKVASPDSTLLASSVVEEIYAAVPADVRVIWSFSGSFPNVAAGFKNGIFPTQKDFEIFRVGKFYGFSDHTPGIRTPLAFIRAGAKMIEKHFKLQDDDDCVDATFSADPGTMKTLCRIAHNK